MNDLTTFEIIILLTILSFVLGICLELFKCLRHGSGRGSRERKQHPEPELDEKNLDRRPVESSNNSNSRTSSDLRLDSSPLRNKNKPRPPPRWWKKFAEKNIFALDAEYVYVHDVGKNEAAAIAIVNLDGDLVCSTKIYHPKGSFANDHDQDEWFRRRNLNLKDRDLDDGSRIEAVKKHVLRLLENNLVILVDEWKGWDSLRITPKDIKKHNITTFDLHKFWRKPSQSQRTKDGGNVYQPIGLRSLMMHYFKVDIQEGIRAAEVDARAIMKLFSEIYPTEKLTHLDKMEGNEGDFDRFAPIFTIK